MNRRQKKKLRHWNYTTAKQRRKNKELCKRYPFLIPRNVWDNKIMWDRDKDTRKWSYTLAEEFPKGWWRAFGLLLCEELRKDLIKCNYLRDFRFDQIKSKYGQLRAYTGPLPMESKANDIIDKYTTLSENICELCGKPDVPMIGKRWIKPECFDCYCKRQIKHIKYCQKNGIEKPTTDCKTIPTREELLEWYNEEKTYDDDERMADKRCYMTYSNGESKYVEIDISETAQKIRENYYGQSNR